MIDILLGYEFLSVIVPAIAVMGMFWRRYKKQGISQSRRHIIYLIVFAVYLFGVYHFTGAGTVFEATRYGIDLKSGGLNLIPFSDPEWDAVGYGLNVVLFVPFGFLMPLIWPQWNRFRYAAGFGALFSVLIEASQLLNIRATDVDDMILNTAGAVVGMMMFRLFSRAVKHTSGQECGCKYEMLVYVGVTFLFRFFVYDEFRMAQLLYGF